MSKTTEIVTNQSNELREEAKRQLHKASNDCSYVIEDCAIDFSKCMIKCLFTRLREWVDDVLSA